MNDLIDGVQDLLVWFSYNLFSLLILAALAVGAAVVIRNRIIKRKNRGKTQGGPDDEK